MTPTSLLFPHYYHASLRIPQGKVLDEDTAVEHHRVCPGGTRRHGVLAQRLKSISTFLGHDQLGVVGEKQEHGAAIHDSRVIRLAAIRSPQCGAVARIETEELPALQVGKAKEEVAAHHHSVRGSIALLPDHPPRFGSEARDHFAVALPRGEVEPSATTGDECPSPTFTFHFSLSFSGRALGSEKALEMPSRLGPRHWGRFCALVEHGDHEQAGDTGCLARKTIAEVYSDLSVMSNGERKAAAVAASEAAIPVSRTATSRRLSEAAGKRPPRSQTAGAIASSAHAVPVTKPSSSRSTFSASTIVARCRGRYPTARRNASSRRRSSTLRSRTAPSPTVPSSRPSAPRLRNVER